MSFIHNCATGSESSCDHVHTIEVLAALTPNDVLHCLNMKMFGATEQAGGTNPIWACANSLALDKKKFIFHAKSPRLECDKN